MFDLDVKHVTADFVRRSHMGCASVKTQPSIDVVPAVTSSPESMKTMTAWNSLKAVLR